jgi:hypothetical protein
MLEDKTVGKEIPDIGKDNRQRLERSREIEESIDYCICLEKLGIELPNHEPLKVSIEERKEFL